MDIFPEEVMGPERGKQSRVRRSTRGDQYEGSRGLRLETRRRQAPPPHRPH